jgi:hypothetical protein
LFEDFKDKIREQDQKSSETTEATALLSPHVIEKLKQEGIDPKNCTLKQLFPEVLDKDGCTDLSLMSGSEFEVMVTFAELRKYLIEKYPQSQQEAKMLGQVWDEEPQEPNQINVAKSKEDPKSKIFFLTLLKMKIIYDKLDVLQAQASEYEKICLRFYWHLTYNWNHAPNIDSFRKCLPDSDIFEVVEAYFKICRKYHVPTFEEPYYFLSEEQKRNVKFEGDMLRRTTDYSDNEIRISILEAFA